jgi:hypothetical protein
MRENEEKRVNQLFLSPLQQLLTSAIALLFCKLVNFLAAICSKRKIDFLEREFSGNRCISTDVSQVLEEGIH